MQSRDTLWTVDGDVTSWAAWAEDMANAQATPLMEELIQSNSATRRGFALDLGCGTGRAFLPLNKAGYQVIGIDPITQGIQLSRDRMLRESLTVNLIQASAAELPIRDGSINFVFAFGTLFHLSPPEFMLALKEIRRVLKEGGKAVLHFLDRDDWRQSLAPGCPPDQIPVPSYKSVVTCFCSKEIIQRWLDEAGLIPHSIDLKTSQSANEQQRNWLIVCKK